MKHDIDRLSLGDHIRRARQRQHCSQERAAKSAGVSRYTYSRIERGMLQPNAETIRLIAELLQLPVDDLLMRAGRIEAATQDAGDYAGPHPEFGYGCPLPRGATEQDPYNAFCARCPHITQLPKDCPGTCNLVAGDFVLCEIREQCPCYAVPCVADGETRKAAFRAYRERRARDEAQWKQYDQPVHERQIRVDHLDRGRDDYV